jgi:polysaccharide pyruvyl transferase WcaK-like protein
VVLVGDVGGASTYHVGDEAMFEADLALVRRLLPRARCIAVSADPESTAATFGIEAVLHLSAADARDPRRAEVPPAIAAAAGADLLVVTGGGNLNSSFPTLIAERLALARATAEAGGAVAVLGQTIGPALTSKDAERVAELLGLACYVGLRDEASAAVARDLGIDESKVFDQLDDAWTMNGSPSAGVAADLQHPVIAMTLHPDPRVVAPRAIGALADQLNQIVNQVGGSVVLVPHCRSGEGPEGRSDEDVSAGLAEQLATRSVPVTQLPVMTPGEVITVTRTADLVISSRYHPLVFAQGGAVPALALWADPYVRAKQVGALAHAGLEAWALPLDEAIGGRLVPAAIELHDRCEEISAWLASVRPALDARMAARDVRLAEALRDIGLEIADVAAAPATSRLPAGAPVPAGGWDQGAAVPAPRPVPDPLLAEFFALRDYARSLEVALDVKRSNASTGDGVGASATSARTTTVLDGVRLEVDATRLALVGRVSGPGIDATEMRFRVYAPDLAARIDASATPMLPIVTMIAARLGSDLVVDAPVDEVAFENAQRATALFDEWWGWRRPRFMASTTTRPVAPASGVGLWFSRGVDSTFTLLSALAGELVFDDRRLTLTHLLGLDWIDPPNAVLSTPDVWADTTAAAASVELPLLRFTTDVRRLIDPMMSWEQSHGAVLASLALLVGPTLGRVFISGSANPLPFGSHPELDPLRSSSGTRVHHFGDTYARSQKVARIACEPWAMRWLKICWKADSSRNCGRCEKCLVTMTMLHAVGALAGAERFDGRLSPEAVRSLTASPGRLTTVPERVDDILRLLPDEDAELRAAWGEVRERLRREEADAPV